MNAAPVIEFMIYDFMIADFINHKSEITNQQLLILFFSLEDGNHCVVKE